MAEEGAGARAAAAAKETALGAGRAVFGPTPATILLLGLGLLILWALVQRPGQSSSPVSASLGISDQTLRQLPAVALAALLVMAVVRFAPGIGALAVMALVLILLLQYEEGGLTRAGR